MRRFFSHYCSSQTAIPIAIFTVNYFMPDYKFARTAFKIQTFAGAEKANLFDKSVSYTERLNQAWFLISQVYGFSLTDQPKLDRNHFSTRKMNN